MDTTRDDAVRLRSGDLAWNEVAGEVVVLDTRTATYHCVTGAGVGLWPMLVAGTTAAELVAHLVETYGVSREAAEADVAVFLADCAPLLEEG